MSEFACAKIDRCGPPCGSKKRKAGNLSTSKSDYDEKSIVGKLGEILIKENMLALGNGDGWREKCFDRHKLGSEAP